MFSSHFRSFLGACFFAPRLEILHTSNVNIYLGIYFEFFYSSPPPPGSNELPGHPVLRGLICISKDPNKIQLEMPVLGLWIIMNLYLRKTNKRIKIRISRKFSLKVTFPFWDFSLQIRVSSSWN